MTKIRNVAIMSAVSLGTLRSCQEAKLVILASYGSRLSSDIFATKGYLWQI